jgi:hypothetical protein
MMKFFAIILALCLLPAVANAHGRSIQRVRTVNRGGGARLIAPFLAPVVVRQQFVAPQRFQQQFVVPPQRFYAPQQQLRFVAPQRQYGQQQFFVPAGNVQQFRSNGCNIF